eukprot:TRINITY_DN12413_c0_g1_i1.p1 TRINITY_DN12413_c0_g1~~TRINITY_DN12413_c0_g1_i1.p1  ORF type:complete len:118 (-),score=1.11 TRINITY_DN12413_c0_g1_i1:75-428(-)
MATFNFNASNTTGSTIAFTVDKRIIGVIKYKWQNNPVQDLAITGTYSPVLGKDAVSVDFECRRVVQGVTYDDHYMGQFTDLNGHGLPEKGDKITGKLSTVASNPKFNNSTTFTFVLS